MKGIKAIVGKTSITGQSLLIIRKKEDPDYMPSVSLQLKTKFAKHIVKLINKDQKNEN